MYTQDMIGKGGTVMKAAKIVKAVMDRLFFLSIYYYYYAYYYVSKVRAFFAAAVWELRLRNMMSRI